MPIPIPSATFAAPGHYVRILGYPDVSRGVVVANCPDRGGCLVRVKSPWDDSEIDGGFGYNELELLPNELELLPLESRPTAWSRLLADSDPL